MLLLLQDLFPTELDIGRVGLAGGIERGKVVAVGKIGTVPRDGVPGVGKSSLKIFRAVPRHRREAIHEHHLIGVVLNPIDRLGVKRGLLGEVAEGVTVDVRRQSF